MNTNSHLLPDLYAAGAELVRCAQEHGDADYLRGDVSMQGDIDYVAEVAARHGAEMPSGYARSSEWAAVFEGIASALDEVAS